MRPSTIVSIATTLFAATSVANGFVLPTSAGSKTFIASASTTSLKNGNIEQIEFRIFPDGRVEETVRGIKGGNCHKVTDEINQALGKVVDSKPTEEMFEQEVVIDQTVELKAEGGEGWEGSSSW